MSGLHLWLLIRPDPVSGPTGRTLSLAFGVLATPIYLAIGFGSGLTLAELVNIVRQRVEPRRLLSALCLLLLCSIGLTFVFYSSILNYWSTSSSINGEMRIVYASSLRSGNIWLLQGLSINPAIPQDLVSTLMKREELHKWLARNPALPPETLRFLAKDQGDSGVVYALIHNPNTPPDVLRLLSNHKLLGKFAAEALKARGIQAQ